MPDTVLNALRQKLERYEAAGMPFEVKRVRARIAEVEKGEKKAAALPMTLSPEPKAAPAVLGATVTKKPTVKKVAAPKKATKSRKK